MTPLFNLIVVVVFKNRIEEKRERVSITGSSAVEIDTSSPVS